MSWVPDNRAINRMGFPGTHDSVSYTNSLFTVYGCQNRNIREQLSDGIRVFDLRLKCKKDYAGTPYFTTCHGDIGLKINYNEYVPLTTILDITNRFLRENNTEGVIFLLKIDDWGDYSQNNRQDRDTIQEALIQILESDTYIKVWGHLTMGGLRNHILIINRTGLNIRGRGVEWPTNTQLYTIQARVGVAEYNIAVQDRYIQPKLAWDKTQEKIRLINALILVDVLPDPGTFKLNFGSQTGGLTEAYVNIPWMQSMRAAVGNLRTSVLGCMFFDFPDYYNIQIPTKGFINCTELVIMSNFNYNFYLADWENPVLPPTSWDWAQWRAI